MIGYNETNANYTSHLYDSQGTVSVHSLTARGDTWTYQGNVTRSTVEFSDGHRVQTVQRERTDDGTTYQPSMRVTLIKVRGVLPSVRSSIHRSVRSAGCVR